MTNPRYMLLMHRGNNAMLWCELDLDEWVLVDNSPQRYQIFVIAGREVTVMVATEDFTLTRAHALKTASSFVFGRYEKITVDLKRLIATKEKGESHGIELEHPPY